LVETTRTLLLGVNLPVHHWGDVIPTACYLINRMLSSSLDNKFPYFIAFPKEPLFFHFFPSLWLCVVL